LGKQACQGEALRSVDGILSMETDLIFGALPSPDTNLKKWVMDESGLNRALLNLVVNANDAVKEKDSGVITVSTFIDTQNHLNIGVSDNGCGIEPDRINNVFQLFFTTKGTKGSGLGLPMVQRFVESLGGTITVESKVDEGTTFNLNIPWIEDN